MEHIYENGNERHTKKVMLYGKTTDHKLYEDSGFTKAVSTEVGKNLFEKGLMLVSVGGRIINPAAFIGSAVTVIDKTGAGSAEFEATKTYTVGSMVTKVGKVYKCTTAITTAAAWDLSKWEEVTSATATEFTLS